MITQLKNETNEDFQAFTHFLKLGEIRSLYRVLQIDANYTMDYLVKTSKKNKWFLRAGEYDQKILDADGDPYKILEKTKEQYSKEHLNLLAKTKLLLTLELDKWIYKAIRSELPTIQMKDLNQTLKQLIDYERLITDQSTININIKKDVDLSKLDDSELDKLLSIQDKLINH